VVLTGLGAGIGAVVLTDLLEAIQHVMWPGPGTLTDAVARAGAWRHLVVLVCAGLLTGAGQVLLTRLQSGNGIEITAAIWFSAGRLPAFRTLGSAVLSVVVVGMGVALGREGAPKQVGAVLANLFSDRGGLSDEQRRLLVACGAGAGMAAAYGVPLGGAVFAIEVLRGVLALRLILPALLTAVVATQASFLLGMPNAPTYVFPAYGSPMSLSVWACLLGPVAGVVSVIYVRSVAWADRNKPQGWRRVVAPVVVLGVLGLASVWFPEVLGNGKEAAAAGFAGSLAPGAMLALLLLRPLATVACLGSGTPGGLFTPSLALGALLGGVLGQAWSWLAPGDAPGAYAIIGAAAVLAATTQGPISAVVLMTELTGQDRALIVPIVLAVIAATAVSRSIEPRSIYDARLSDAEVAARLKSRDPPPHP
jgi:CIC family chloride channel protein